MAACISPACPICEAPGFQLGHMGSLRWYRCRNCGMDFSRSSHRREPPIEMPAAEVSVTPSHATPRHDVSSATDNVKEQRP